MMPREVVIFATLQSESLDKIETNLKESLASNRFKRVEQGTVLLYDDTVSEFSIEPHNNSFYMSGRIRKNLELAIPLLLTITTNLAKSRIEFSLDYQEESHQGEQTSPEFNIKG